jgi:hypothetical protein
VYEAKFIFDDRYCKSVYDFNGIKLLFAAGRLSWVTSRNSWVYGRRVLLPIVESLLVTDSEKVVTYEIGIYIDNEFVIQVFSKDGDFIKNTK